MFRLYTQRREEEEGEEAPTCLSACQPACLIYKPNPTQPCNSQKKAMSSSSVVVSSPARTRKPIGKDTEREGKKKKSNEFQTGREGKRKGERKQKPNLANSPLSPFPLASKFVCLYMRGPNTPRKTSVSRALCHVLYKSSSRNL